MGKFIKVTDSADGSVSFYNASEVTCFRDGELWAGEYLAKIV